MAVKLTIEEMKQIAKSRGGGCLSSVYVNITTKLEWQCEFGHKWKAVPDTIKQGSWCPNCAGLAKLTIEEMHNLAKSKNGKCLSQICLGSLTKLTWQCEFGHIFEMKPNAVKNGQWCNVCGGTKKLILDDMHKLATGKNGKCLSEIYVNSVEKLKWQCEVGHVFYMDVHHVKCNRWCPYCANVAPLTIEEMHDLALKHNGKCLSAEYLGTREKLLWQCHNGHTWYATPNTIKNGHWCLECSGSKKLTIEEMQNIADERGGKCLSNNYVNATTKLEWQCALGHKWMAQPSGIKQGQWCPKCNLAFHVYQEICRKYLEKLFEYEFVTIRPDWIINPKTGRKLELDGYCAELNIAFEYQGQQHYLDIYGDGPEKFETIKYRDKLKKDICKKLEIKLMIIPYWEKNNFKNYIDEKCKEFNIAPKNNKIDIDLSKIKKEIYSKYKELVLNEI